MSLQLRPVSPTKLLLFGNVYDLEKVAGRALFKVLRLYKAKFILVTYGTDRDLGPLVKTLHSLNDFGDGVSPDELERCRRHIIAFHTAWHKSHLKFINTGVVVEGLIDSVNGLSTGDLTTAKISLTGIPDDQNVVVDNGGLAFQPKQVALEKPAGVDTTIAAQLQALRTAITACGVGKDRATLDKCVNDATP
jgi:hypothetical protein